MVAGGLYSATALRENNEERFTVYARHQLKLQAQTTKPWEAYVEMTQGRKRERDGYY